MFRFRASGPAGLAALLASLALCRAPAACAGEFVVRADKPNAVTFPAREAKFVRFEHRRRAVH